MPSIYFAKHRAESSKLPLLAMSVVHLMVEDQVQLHILLEETQSEWKMA
jgi:hypothetical protein